MSDLEGVLIAIDNFVIKHPEIRGHKDFGSLLRDLWIEAEKLTAELARLTAENERLSQMLHDELSQLEIATDLGNKRWLALNDIYENGEKHNSNWCKRKAQEGLGIKNA